MRIEGSKYIICYDDKTNTISFSGKLRLDNIDKSLSQLVGLLDQILEEEPDQITLDVRQLEFLNSLGISTISKFIIKVRNRRSIHAAVKASKESSWQSKSIVNLKKIMPSLSLSWD
ncbi:hypothetical protein C7271_00100 [filamentous cyanobacterium CCP5]|nr:hypothetical protein C7271_00100 [filamentous cyanobacterium CCP5]